MTGPVAAAPRNAMTEEPGHLGGRVRRRHALVAVAAVASGLAGCGDERPRAGLRWPALAVRELGGRPATIPPVSAGTRVINIWALWCAPCRRELPSLNRLAAVLAPRGIEVSTIAVAQDGFAIREYLIQHGLGLPSVVIAPGGPELARLRVESLPQTFVVAPDGAVLARWVGEREWDAAAVRLALDRVLPSA